MMSMNLKVTVISVYGTIGDVNAICNDITMAEYLPLIGFAAISGCSGLNGR